MESVRCPCGDTENDGLMIFCEMCSTWQHALCFSINSEDGIPQNHVCHLCDEEFYNDAAAEDLRLICLKRRVIDACKESSSFSAKGISNKLNCDLATAEHVLETLQEDGLLIVRGNRTKRWFVKKQKYGPNVKDVPKTADGSSNGKKFFVWDL